MFPRPPQIIQQAKRPGESGKWFRFKNKLALNCPKCNISFEVLDKPTPEGYIDKLVMCPRPVCSYASKLKLEDYYEHRPEDSSTNS